MGQIWTTGTLPVGACVPYHTPFSVSTSQTNPSESESTQATNCPTLPHLASHIACILSSSSRPASFEKSSSEHVSCPSLLIRWPCMRLHAPACSAPRPKLSYIVIPLRQGANDAATKSFPTHRGSLDHSMPGLRPAGSSIHGTPTPSSD